MSDVAENKAVAIGHRALTSSASYSGRLQRLPKKPVAGQKNRDLLE